MIAVWIIVRGQALPFRGHLLERLPRVGIPRLALPALIGALFAGFVIIALGSQTTQGSVALSAGYGLICLSLVLLTCGPAVCRPSGVLFGLRCSLHV